MNKRILALFIAVVMVLGMVPNVFAITEDTPLESTFIGNVVEIEDYDDGHDPNKEDTTSFDKGSHNVIIEKVVRDETGRIVPRSEWGDAEFTFTVSLPVLGKFWTFTLDKDTPSVSFYAMLWSRYKIEETDMPKNYSNTDGVKTVRRTKAWQEETLTFTNIITTEDEPINEPVIGKVIINHKHNGQLIIDSKYPVNPEIKEGIVGVDKWDSDHRYYYDQQDYVWAEELIPVTGGFFEEGTIEVTYNYDLVPRKVRKYSAKYNGLSHEVDFLVGDTNGVLEYSTDGTNWSTEQPLIQNAGI